MKKHSGKGFTTVAVVLCVVGFSIALLVTAAALDRETFMYGAATTGLTVILVPIICALIDKRKKKKTANEKQRQREEELKNLDTEKLDNIISEIKARTETRAYRIEAEKSEGIKLTDSKFGGLPYWPENMAYPENKDGEKLILLAQINFDEARLHDSRLPKKGMLQFFVATDELSGADFEDPTNQNDFRVVYHSEVDYKVKEETVRALGVKACTDFDYRECYLPLTEELKLSFEEYTDYMSCTVEKFNEVVDGIMRECYGEELEGGSVWKAFNYTEFDYLTKPFDNFGHKMLGYPAFTQSDPRGDGEFETLLLQIDSIGNIMWGDCGVANFFINENDLKKLDFGKVMYTWDCY